MTESASLADELAINEVDHDELVTLLSFSFPSGQWRGGNSVTYRAEDGTIGLTLTYRGSRLTDVKRGPGLTDEMLTTLRERIASLADEGESVVWRDVFFNVLPVAGYWRYRDDWQIVPAPSQAPRPEFLLGDHPFIAEIRVPRHGDDGPLRAVSQQRRAWEVQLILNLVLRHRVSRFTMRATDHTWAYVDGETKYVQPGYLIPDWIYQSSDFTATDGIPPVPEVPSDEYHTRLGIGSDDVFEIPDILRPLLDHYHAVAPETRRRFLHACHWYERSGGAWSTSVSLGHIAAVNSIETLLPPWAEDLCPTCGSNLAPGVTQLFRDFIEQYASTVPRQDRRKIYDLRSALLHRGHVLDIDIPGPWGALVPGDHEQRDTYQSAREAARAAITNWLLDQ
jgi:hypothetical protein